MGDVEALGLLKMDFLGLRNLDVIDEALALIDEPTSTCGRCRSTTRRPYAMLTRGDVDRRLPVRVVAACARRCAR